MTDGPVFFLDRNLGGLMFPRALADAGIRAERHDDHFPQDAADETWIGEVARRGWYALSNDKRIHKNPVQRDAVVAAGLGFFVLTGANAPMPVLAANFVQTFPAVLRFVERTPRPFVASVRRPNLPGRSGRVERLYPRPSRG